MTIFNSIISQAISQGVSVETITLLMLLPLVATLVAAARHLIGFRGFGIFIPTALAVVFVAIGIEVGVLLFLAILVVDTFGRRLFRKLRLHYLPRTALILWLVSLAVLALIFISPSFGLEQLTQISLFPVLILVLLAEEFMTVQIGKSWREATRLTLETFAMALLGYLIFNLQFFQQLAIKKPLWVALAPPAISLLVGRYAGLRLLEYRRFRRLLK